MIAPKFDDPETFLQCLRWREDTKVTNDFGEHVWLKVCFVGGKRVGITDCCPVDNPCPKHRAMQVREAQAEKN